MQERSRKPRSGRAGFKNQNRALTDACRDSIRSLTEGIPAGYPATDYLRSEYLSKFNG